MYVMQELNLEPTENTPRVEFRKDGNLYFTGRFIPEDTKKFFKPLEEWVTKLESEKVVFHVKLDYINTASSKQLFSLFKLASEDPRFAEVMVKWHYEEDDEDMLEAGEYFESLLSDVDFEFIPCPEIIF
jgi:hypothetical protein